MVEMVFASESKRSMVGNVECVEQRPRWTSNVNVRPPMERSTRVDLSTPPHDLSSNLSQQAHLASAMLSGSQLGQLGQFNVPFQHPNLTLSSVMPWELLSRLRRPVRRQPTPEPPLQNAMPHPQQEHSAQQVPIDRKILADPSSFLEAEAQHALPLGLTPSTRVPPADGSSNPRSRPRQKDVASEPLSERSELPAGPSVDISPRTESRPTITRLSKIAAGGEWSTFGRKREHQISGRTSPKRTSRSPSPTKDNKHLSVDSTLSTFTLSRPTNPLVGHEVQSSPGTRSPDPRFSSKHTSPTNTMSSKRHPQTPQRPSSYTIPAAAHATSPVTNLTTPVNRVLAVDSPHTFGHPTPPDNPVDLSYPCPPPLPPLDHPELISSRRESTFIGQPALSAFRDRSNTLPTDRQPPRKDALFTSLSLRLGRSVRQRSSLSQANTAMTGHPRQRARTVSGGARRRRTSADWSSYQASVGVNSQANQAWPAEVSREMLRLSLPESVPGSSDKRKQRTRGGSTDPVRLPVTPSSFLPFPHPSRPNSPPLTASATLPGASTPSSLISSNNYSDRRELRSPRPHSLQFDLGNRRGREQPVTRFAMAEVKRSSSAIESRNGHKNEAGGATYPSLGSNDPGASEATSFALTPSRSLLSGRVSPSNTPMVSSVHGVPSTPTPAPRHLSDKSRGKRKAEDNLDLTPPEQKKEGQRATFLLPSETRSKCHPCSLPPQTALSAPAQLETPKVSEYQMPRTPHRRTTASAPACRRPLLSLLLFNRDQRLSKRRPSLQVAITVSHLFPAVPALV